MVIVLCLYFVLWSWRRSSCTTTSEKHQLEASLTRCSRCSVVEAQRVFSSALLGYSTRALTGDSYWPSVPATKWRKSRVDAATLGENLISWSLIVFLKCHSIGVALDTGAWPPVPEPPQCSWGEVVIARRLEDVPARRGRHRDECNLKNTRQQSSFVLPSTKFWYAKRSKWS